MLHWLIDPYQSQFMRHAIVIAVIVGVLSPTVGVWIVLRRLAYMGDAMGHATLAGVAGAYLLGFSITLGALFAGLVMGGAVALLRKRRRLGQDAIIGTVETGLFALGVMLITRNDNIGIDLSHFLFGQITTVTNSDLVLNGILALVAIVGVAMFFGDLRMASFDPAHARQVGVKVSMLDAVLLVALSIAIVVCLSTVGILMSIAMLVVPASTGRLLTSRTMTMTWVSVGLGLGASIGGLTMSYHLSSPPGATIALVAVTQFAIVFALTIPRRLRHQPATG